MKISKMKTNESTVTLTLTRDQADALEWIVDYGINSTHEHLAHLLSSSAESDDSISEVKAILQAAKGAHGVLQAALDREIFAHDQ
jgi:hypothetical protein